MSALFEAEALESDHVDSVELRVLAGEQAGARVVLAPGEYFLGSGDECSLVLRGRGIVETHGLLRFDGSNADIEPLNGVICNVQGDEITGAHTMGRGVPFEIGDVWIAVDSEDAPWPDTASDFRQSTAAAEVGETLGAATSDIGDALAAPEASGTSDASDNAIYSQASSSKRLAAAFTGVVFLMLLAIAVWTWWSTHGEPSREAQRIEPAVEQPQQAPDELQRIVANLRQTADLKLKRVGKQWVVSGYLSDAESKRTLLEQLANLGNENVKAEVWADAELLEAAKHVIAAKAVPGEAGLRVDKVVAGVATLTGAVASEASLEEAKKAVIDGVPGVVSVVSNALRPGELLQKLKERIATAGLASRLVIMSDAPEVKLTGRLYPEEIAKWESLFVEFSRDYGDVLPIRATVTRVIPKPPVGVQTIIGGSVPYIVTDSGQFVNQGGDVQGHTLTSIRDGEVVFEGSKRVRLAR
ncbi:type III secretion system inner membrane ring subunit SctD [Noviherbaspirillum pedocola]|uniref:Type III secretion system inner membrane ring subunit SctD n=1 Tax=Noviherbaspirillum pedocola TaxID=2801341 RepID=A0A934SWP0_9BURK|nr:type III secretion system inner membrane ring subunit SctD [Noviherbaspirillum pedocola]MBK4733223.1 type III secretion system inner membrane ring subunit SctD [Noviherbaspirillum pedocola]